MEKRPVYLDCNASTPLDERVRDAMFRVLDEGPSNAGSRTHEYGARASRLLERSREAVASVVHAVPEEVFFTSGATESNNLAILGLAAFGAQTERRHIVCSSIEHKAVLEPVERLQRLGFRVSFLPALRNGQVDSDALPDVLTEDTLLVSVMHVNNETGVIQPLDRIASALDSHHAYFHVDAAQGFGKELDLLRQQRIDMISVSSHKIYGPPGIGALIARRRERCRPPLEPLVHGGGQERGLRPGTVPVAQAVGMGEAARLALEEHSTWQKRCREFREALLAGLAILNPRLVTADSPTLPNVASLQFGDIDSEAVIVALRHLVAISNGSACTSSSYSPSHVLSAMGLSPAEAAATTRWSWCQTTAHPDWDAIVRAVQRIM